MREFQRLNWDALSAAGCERTFSGTASGVAADRPMLADLLSHARSGDTVIVWRLDRLGRSLQHLIQVVQRLESEGVAFRSLTEGIDTSTANGRLFFHIFGALAQFERDLIQERTHAGLANCAGPRTKGRAASQAER